LGPVQCERIAVSSIPQSFETERLGEPVFRSPLELSSRYGELRSSYVKDDERVLYGIEFSGTRATLDSAEVGAFEKAGPRETIYFDPRSVHAGIVTCGGLCPGLNDVIRAIVMTLWAQYGVRRVTGFRYGYRGLLAEPEAPPVPLEPRAVAGIHRQGGTILGTARGGGEHTGEIVDTLVRYDINMLFAIGGDGTQRGALKLARELERRRLPIAIVGVPKTIDNDLSFVERSFGFETAVAEAVRAVDGAYTEARDSVGGIGLVKLMGRDSGFIAVHAALASNEADFVLIPEVPFDLDGPSGFLHHLERRVIKRGFATIVVAEGAGQTFVSQTGTDAGGNPKLGDIGPFLRDKIAEHFKRAGREVAIKYIDPSYSIRSQAANPADSIYCARLGANAVHAAMSGRTACLVGTVNHRLVHVPIFAASHQRNRVNPEGPLWRDVVVSSGMPLVMQNPPD
jgi:6-phosphofructokinase 1